VSSSNFPAFAIVEAFAVAPHSMMYAFPLAALVISVRTVAPVFAIVLNQKFADPSQVVASAIRSVLGLLMKSSCSA
jgi:hypothetical protein